MIDRSVSDREDTPSETHRSAVRELAPAPRDVDGLRPLKRWRYVGVYGRELTLCVAAVRKRRDHLLVVRSRYRQPFGTFDGALPAGTLLAEGHGVMEEHDAWW